VTTRARGDPDVLPRRRDDQGTDAVEDGRVANELSVGTQILEALAFTHAMDPRFVVARVNEPGFLRGLRGRVGWDG
jgi:hypothetical protein